MTTSKERVTRLALLDREFRALGDAELVGAIAALKPEAQSYLAKVAGQGDGTGFNVEGLRGAAQRGRMKGVLERVTAVVSDPCLEDCINSLGDNADLPSEDDLAGVLPGLAERHGIAITRLMMASAVIGEAPAAPILQRLLKTAPYLQAGTPS